jgi:hypothetical protein
MSSRESNHRFNGFSSDANKDFDFLLQSKIENLEVIGYRGYVCQNCLIVHPLRIYKDKFNPTPHLIQTKHSCDMERLVEIQHRKVDKDSVLIDLYRNQLLRVMLSAVRE